LSQSNCIQAFAFALQLATYRSVDTSLKPALRFLHLTISEAERCPILRAALPSTIDEPMP
jgi:hypothetical protein